MQQGQSRLETVRNKGVNSSPKHFSRTHTHTRRSQKYLIYRSMGLSPAIIHLKRVNSLDVLTPLSAKFIVSVSISGFSDFSGMSLFTEITEWFSLDVEFKVKVSHSKVKVSHVTEKSSLHEHQRIYTFKVDNYRWQPHRSIDKVFLRTHGAYMSLWKCFGLDLTPLLLTVSRRFCPWMWFIYYTEGWLALISCFRLNKTKFPIPVIDLYIYL